MDDARPKMSGKRVLLVEDEYLIAKSMARRLASAGIEVVGPVPTVAEALALLKAEALDGAVLDINLRGEMVFPVADALTERGIPFVFATGYDGPEIPPRYAHVMRSEKPVNLDGLVEALLS